MSGGLAFGHAYAVRFNYPIELLAVDPRMLISYTVNMANAVTPSIRIYSLHLSIDLLGCGSERKTN